MYTFKAFAPAAGPFTCKNLKISQRVRCELQVLNVSDEVSCELLFC